MKSKKWTKLFLIGVLISVFLCVVAVFIFDPFVQYHKPWFGKVAYDSKYERYLISGLAKNYDYRSICIGSSMTRRFLISELEKVMQKPIKFTMSGAIAHEINLALNQAIKYNKDIETVLIGFDLFSIKGDKNLIAINFPINMYNNNLFDYFLNFYNMKIIISNFTKSISGNNVVFDYEHMFKKAYFDSEQDFNSTKLINKWYDGKQNKKRIAYFGDGYKFKNINRAKESFQYNYISLIKNNPQIKFIIFYPPYSVLVYKDWEYISQLDEVIKSKKYFMQEFEKYKNTEVYDFQDDENITTNLNLYLDPSHYHQKINTYIAERIAVRDPRYLVDPATYDERLAHFKKYVSEYKTKFDEE